MISFVIPTYNREDTIERCLRSIYSIKCNKEVIVIDDDSKDKTINIIRKKFPKVKIIKNNYNKGPSYSRNMGIRDTRGDHIFFVDSDVYLTKDILKKFLRHKDYDILFPKIIFENKTLMYPSNKKEETYLKASTVFLIKRDKIIKNNLFFDELYYMVEEDTDFFIRCKLKGLKCKYIKEATAIHTTQSKVSLNLENKYYLTTKNHIYAYIKLFFIPKYIKNLFEFPRFKLIIKDLIMALFNINLLSITSIEGRTKIKSNKIKLLLLFNGQKLTRNNIILMKLFVKAIYWNIINMRKIIKRMII